MRFPQEWKLSAYYRQTGVVATPMSQIRAKAVVHPTADQQVWVWISLAPNKLR